jgi:hypothetical protein
MSDCLRVFCCPRFFVRWGSNVGAGLLAKAPDQAMMCWLTGYISVAAVTAA